MLLANIALIGLCALKKKRNKMRNTKQKDYILNNLKNRLDHPTAQQIYNSAKKDNINIGYTTTYRILNNLTEQGKACKLITKDNIAHYDYITNNHIHLICNICGKILDIPNEVVFNKKFNAKNWGFNINSQEITVYGVCENCKNIETKKYKN